jgi:hypothetical protein
MYGWPSVFYLFAVLGGIWCLLWPLVRPGMQVRAFQAELYSVCGVCWDSSGSRSAATSWWVGNRCMFSIVSLLGKEGGGIWCLLSRWCDQACR